MNIEYCFPVSCLRGKVGKSACGYHTVRYGKKIYVKVENPRTGERASAHEKAYRRYFGQMQLLAAQIYRDPVISQPYMERFANQTAESNLSLTGKCKLYKKRDSFIQACLLKQHPFVESEWT